MIIYRIDETFKKIKDVLFMNEDFRNVLPKKIQNEQENKETFIYADPIYLITTIKRLERKDTIDCFQSNF